MPDFSKPQKVISGLEAITGVDVYQLMPAYADIPGEFKKHSGKWVDFQQRWFFRGLEDATIIPKDGIDLKAALKHMSAIQRSWEPAHEHKQAGVAYLASRWLKDVKYGKETSDAS